MNNKLPFNFLFALLLLGFMVNANAALVISDGDFSAWNGFAFGPSSYTRIATGGAPGAYLSMTASGSQGALVLFAGGAAYDPATDGAISSISFSADLTGTSDMLTTAGDPVPQFGFVLVQGGVWIYAHYVAFDAVDWTHVATGNLVSSDFGLPPGASGSPGVSDVPDFSTAGDRIQFGVIVDSEAAPGMDFGMDNFTLNVNTVPLPAAVYLFGSALGLLGWHRRSVAGRS